MESITQMPMTYDEIDNDVHLQLIFLGFYLHRREWAFYKHKTTSLQVHIAHGDKPFYVSSSDPLYTGKLGGIDYVIEAVKQLTS